MRSVGNSLGIIIPKAILEGAGIKKGDTIAIEIDMLALKQGKRQAWIEEMRGLLKRRFGDVELDYELDETDEADKPEYEGRYP